MCVFLLGGRGALKILPSLYQTRAMLSRTPNLVCECIQLQWLSVCECVSDQSLLLTLSPLPALSCEERLLGGGESGGAGRSGSSRPQAEGADEETATLSSAT